MIAGAGDAGFDGILPQAYNFRSHRLLIFWSRSLNMTISPVSSVAPQSLLALTEDEQLFRDSVRQFAEEAVRPLVKEMDEKGVFEHSLIEQFFQLGLMGIEIPEQYGGGGASFFEAILAVEELSRVDPSAAVVVDVQNTLVNNAILRWANEEQKKKYLPKMASEWVGAYALSEAGSGSDAFALQCRAQDKGDHWLLNGQKMWITNGKEADLFIMLTTVDPAAGYRGITAFLVEKSFPGFSVGKKEDKLGIRASSTCELILEDCKVPKENLLGEVGKGYKIAIETLNEGRIGIGAQMLGLAQGALDVAVKYAQERKQFGQPLANFQGIQFQLAQMATEVTAAAHDGLQRRPNERRRHEFLERSGDDQAVLLAGCRARGFSGRGNPWRLRLHKRLSGGKIFPRFEDRQHLRRNFQYAVGDHRQAGAGRQVGNGPGRRIAINVPDSRGPFSCAVTPAATATLRLIAPASRHAIFVAFQLERTLPRLESPPRSRRSMPARR